jgi:uncharacterized protein YecE (DUF72 family)
MKGKIYIGTSGWSYSDWKGSFYPDKTKSTDYLPFYAQSFHASEINSSFYHTPRISTVEGWTTKVPDDFKFCPKMSRYLTQMKRLKDPEEPLQKFFTAFEPMTDKIGIVLVQLPPSLQFDEEVATHFFNVLKRDYHKFKFALEVRHKSWLEELPLTLIRENDISLVISQSGVGYPYAEMITTRNVYLRFHGPAKLFSSSYSDEMLQDYADKIKTWSGDRHTIWAFFNNTMGMAGLNNARTLKKMLGIKK